MENLTELNSVLINVLAARRKKEIHDPPKTDEKNMAPKREGKPRHAIPKRRPEKEKKEKKTVQRHWRTHTEGKTTSQTSTERWRSRFEY
jgi:hypothetical protein